MNGMKKEVTVDGNIVLYPGGISLWKVIIIRPLEKWHKLCTESVVREYLEHAWWIKSIKWCF